jgi:transcriptional regulator with XRE-family HTH domain
VKDMKTTKYGQFVRKLRIDRGIVLKDMADDLGVSVPMLSAMELGKRKIKDEVLSNIIKVYNLSDLEEVELYKAAVTSLNTIDIDISDKSEAVKELTAAFARKVNDGAMLNIEAIRKLLN